MAIHPCVQLDHRRQRASTAVTYKVSVWVTSCNTRRRVWLGSDCASGRAAGEGGGAHRQRVCHTGKGRGVPNTVVSPCVADPRRHCTYLWVQGSLSRLLSSLLGVGPLLKKGQEAPGGKGLEDAVVAAGPIAEGGGSNDRGHAPPQQGPYAAHK